MPCAGLHRGHHYLWASGTYSTLDLVGVARFRAACRVVLPARRAIAAGQHGGRRGDSPGWPGGGPARVRPTIGRVAKRTFRGSPERFHEKLTLEQTIASRSTTYTRNLDRGGRSANNSLERVFGATFRSVTPLAYSRENVRREGPP